MLEDRRLLSAIHDFGDVPVPYPVTLAENGALHEATGPSLGTLRDGDGNGTHSANADFDDLNGTSPDDEDGVTIGTMRVGQLDATVTVNVQGAAGKLDAWIDFNGDGSWGGPGEQIFDSRLVAVGDNSLTFDVPSYAIAGTTYARFRLSKAGGLGVTGTADDGEVEDYQVLIASPTTASGIFGGPHSISTAEEGEMSVFAADVDGDSDLDVLSASFSDNRIAWYENMALDFGDAPVPYPTTAAENGARHIATGPKLGANRDEEADGMHSAGAKADDVDVALPDDEDAVLDPLDLLGTVGTQPTVTLLATNTAGNAAMLFGWIDYNRDGVFDNATERASIVVPDATTNGRFTLTFPVIPTGVSELTYARFRLSTDTAAENPTAAAADGEVEDHVFTITKPSSGTTDHSIKVAHELNGGPALVDRDLFGRSLASLGDLDGNGVADLAVGAYGDDTGGTDRGAVHLLLLNTDGSVKNSTKIAQNLNGGPPLTDNDLFGSSVAAVGDLDGDGVADLAVGANSDDTGGDDLGAVYVLLLNADGSVRSSTKIACGTNGGPALAGRASFGVSVASVGDLDGDGLADLAVGAFGDDTGGTDRGAVHLLLLNADGSVKNSTKIAHNLNGGPALTDSDLFGRSVAAIGDLDGNGVTDLAVGANSDDTGGDDLGAVYVLLLNADGSVKSSTKIASGTNGGPTLAGRASFGVSVASVGDLDGDGLADLAVGAYGDDTGGTDRGAVHLLLLNADGSVKNSTKIAQNLNSGPTLTDHDLFGSSVAAVGDLDGDGMVDLAIGASSDDTGGNDRGAVHVLFLKAPPIAVIVPENTTQVLTVMVLPPVAMPRYSLANEADHGLFRVDAVSGLLQFNVAPDFENPLDADGDNVYDVYVLIDDQQGGVTTETVHVTVIEGSETPWQNPAGRFDIDANGSLSPSLLDLLSLINFLNSGGIGPLPQPTADFEPPDYFDVNGDGSATPLDVIQVVNEFNVPTLGGEAEGDQLPVSLNGAIELVRYSHSVDRLLSGCVDQGRPAADAEHLVRRPSPDIGTAFRPAEQFLMNPGRRKLACSRERSIDAALADFEAVEIVAAENSDESGVLPAIFDDVGP